MNRKLFTHMLINALGLVNFLALLLTGSILKFTLPPGSGGLDGGHGHRAAERMVLTCLGWTRHEWGVVHFWISLSFLALLLLHLVMHGAWISAVAWGTPQKPQSILRRLMTLGIVGLVVAALVLPFVLPKQQLSRATLKAQHGISEALHDKNR